MFCQLVAILIDFLDDVLYVHVRVDFLGDAAVDSNQRNHWKQSAIGLMFMVSRCFGEQLSAML